MCTNPTSASGSQVLQAGLYFQIPELRVWLEAIKRDKRYECTAGSNASITLTSLKSYYLPSEINLLQQVKKFIMLGKGKHPQVGTSEILC